MNIWAKLFGSGQDRLNQRMREIGQRVAKNAIRTQGPVDTEQEARQLVRTFAISSKPRDVSAYRDVADHLLATYEPSVAYFVAVKIDIQMRPTLGYVPIGQIVLAIEQAGQGERIDRAADFLTCALLNLGTIEMARQAFTLYRSPKISSAVAARLRSYDGEVASFIVG